MIPIDKNIYQHESTIIENIRQRMRDWSHLDFTNWYENALKDLLVIRDSVLQATRVKYPIEEVFGVCAILSPASKWAQNLKDTERLLLEYTEPTKYQFNYFTYGANVSKARALLEAGIRGAQSIIEHSFKTAPKTRDFYKCLISPSCGIVVIDRHMLTIAGLNNKGRMSPNQYAFIQGCYIQAFDNTRLKQFEHKPYSVSQARLWCAYQYYFKNTKH